MDVDQALEHLLDGESILFIGAGFSLGAKNVRNEGLKTGRQFAEHLSLCIGLTTDTSLEDAAEEYADLKGDDALIHELRSEFTATEVADHHVVLAKAPWRRIYTTNYDNVLETAAARSGHRLNPVTTADNIRVLPKDDLVVHLNGYVDRLNRETLWSSFKLTATSYVATSLSDSPWMTLFRQDIAMARAVFFVGYSLTDLDIKRLLFATTELRDKTFFVLGKIVDPATTRRASKYGNILPLDSLGFATELSKKEASYLPRDRSEYVGDAIVRFEPPCQIPEFSDKFIFNLFLRGDVESAFVWNSLHNGNRYFLERLLASRVLKLLTTSNSVVVVHSELGNGKTLILEGIKSRAAEDGIDVFMVKSRTVRLFEELDIVCRASKKTLLIIDNYADWLDVAEHVGLRAGPEVSLLFTARTPINDVLIDRLTELLKRDDVAEVAVDNMDISDLEWIIDCFDEYGLWGIKANWNRNRKLEYLERQCNSQFGQILLDLLKAPHIISRLQILLDVIKNKRDYYEVILTILVLSVLNFPTSIDTLVDIWGDRVLSTKFRKNEAIRQLVNLDRGTISLRSAVAGKYLLQKSSDAGVIVESLIKIARATDRSARTSIDYNNLRGELMRFGNLQLLLPEHNRRASVIRYYESVKNLGMAKGNAHFWLQYAIAALVFKDLERAKQYFDTAYSFARQIPNYNTFMIDNHFARYLLESAMCSENIEAAMTEFRKAQDILRKQLVQRERFHYPYRVACTYKDFYDRWGDSLSSTDREEFGRAVAYVTERIARLPDHKQKQKYVSQCAEAMAQIVKRILSTPK